MKKFCIVILAVLLSCLMVSAALAADVTKNVGDTFSLSFSISGFLGYDDWTWKVTDTSILKITSSGEGYCNLRALSPGTCKVTCRVDCYYNNGNQNVEYTDWTVEIKPGTGSDSTPTPPPLPTPDPTPTPPPPTSGSCGDNASWKFDRSSGVLSITGSGDIQDRPWIFYYSSEMLTVSIGNGITGIATDNAFRGCST